MGVRLPGSTSRLFDPKIVEGLLEVEKIPVEQAKKRRDGHAEIKDEFTKLDKMVNDLDLSLNGLKSKQNFYKLKVESSHPDIIDGTITGYAMTGTYEFEVRGLARNEKELAYGYPDRNETPVGFGYMLIEREDKDDFELIVEPDSTLDDVVQGINDLEAGVKAMVINTKYKPEPYRLLVISEESGQEAKVYIDEDTTFLEFKEQVTGRNLDILFEDVPVTDENNDLEELVDGVVFSAKRSEPGTRVQVSIVNDIDKTLEGIQEWVNKYNEVASFVSQQFAIDPETKRGGLLASESAVKTVQRHLQQSIVSAVNTGGKYMTLSEIGITTDPKTGLLNMDEAKVRGALSEDYDAVARLFIRERDTTGVGERMATAIKSLRDPQAGVLRSRVRGLERVIKGQDEIIERKERMMEQKQEQIKRKFTNLESQLSGLKSQGDFLSQKFGAGAAQ